MSWDAAVDMLDGRLDEIRDRTLESDKYRVAAVAASGAIASYAAVDQMFDGNSEVADVLGHYALGVAGSLSGELGYRLSGLEEEYGSKSKYAAMFLSGVAAGGAGQGAQYFISGAPDLSSVYQGAVGSLWTTSGQAGIESRGNDD